MDKNKSVLTGIFYGNKYSFSTFCAIYIKFYDNRK